MGAVFSDVFCEVFAPGTQDYESMVTLARMVAQCGSSFEDVVKQRKNQEPNHW